MAENTRCIAFSLTLLSCVCLACNGQPEADTSMNEVLEFARDRLAASTAQLGDRIDECSQLSGDNPVPVVDQAEIEFG